MEWKIPVIFFLWIMICLDKNKITNGYVFLSSNGSDYMKIGDSLELTCDAYEGSKSDGVRFYRSPYTSYTIHIFNTTSCLWMQSDLQHRYTVSCKEERVFTVVQNNIQIEDHQTRWICERSGISNFFVVSVGVPVTTVQLAVFQVDETKREFLCDTSPKGSRPEANFRWYKQRGHETPELIDNHSIQYKRQPVSVPGQAQADLVISSSASILSADSYQEIYIYCTASNLNNVEKDVQSNVQSTRDFDSRNSVHFDLSEMWRKDMATNTIEQCPCTTVTTLSDTEKEEEKHPSLTLTLVMICVSGFCMIFIIVVTGTALIIRRGRRLRSTANEAIIEGYSNPISEQRTADEEQTNEHQANSDQRPFTVITASDTTAKNYDRGTIDWYLKILTHPHEEDNTACLPVARDKNCI